MTTELAVKWLKDLNKGLAMPQYEDALEMAIQALQAQTDGDLVSRQAVLDYIDKMPSELTADGRRMIRRRTLEEYISDTLPSVNPQEPKWIPVSERLPEEKQEKYLCTFDDGSIGMDWYEHCKSKWRWHSKTYRGYGTNVVAWMPLPKPYKAESEDKE